MRTSVAIAVLFAAAVAVAESCPWHWHYRTQDAGLRQGAARNSGVLRAEPYRHYQIGQSVQALGQIVLANGKIVERGTRGRVVALASPEAAIPRDHGPGVRVEFTDGKSSHEEYTDTTRHVGGHVVKDKIVDKDGVTSMLSEHWTDANGNENFEKAQMWEGSPTLVADDFGVVRSDLHLPTNVQRIIDQTRHVFDTQINKMESEGDTAECRFQLMHPDKTKAQNCTLVDVMIDMLLPVDPVMQLANQRMRSQLSRIARYSARRGKKKALGPAHIRAMRAARQNDFTRMGAAHPNKEKAANVPEQYDPSASYDNEYDDANVIIDVDYFTDEEWDEFNKELDEYLVEKWVDESDAKSGANHKGTATATRLASAEVKNGNNADAQDRKWRNWALKLAKLQVQRRKAKQQGNHAKLPTPTTVFGKGKAGRSAKTLQFSTGEVPSIDRSTCDAEGTGWRSQFYGLMSSGYDVGATFSGTLAQCVAECERVKAAADSPAEECHAFARKRNEIGDDDIGECWMKNTVLEPVGDWLTSGSWATYVVSCPAQVAPCTWEAVTDISLAHVEQLGVSESVETQYDCMVACEQMADCMAATFNLDSKKCTFSQNLHGAQVDHSEFTSYACTRTGPRALPPVVGHPCDDPTTNPCDLAHGQCVKELDEDGLVTDGYTCKCDDDNNPNTTYMYTCLTGCSTPFTGHQCKTWADWNSTVFRIWSDQIVWVATLREVNRTKKEAMDDKARELAAETASAEGKPAGSVWQQRKFTAEVAFNSAKLLWQSAQTELINAIGDELQMKQNAQAANLAKSHYDANEDAPHRIYGPQSEREWSRRSAPLQANAAPVKVYERHCQTEMRRAVGEAAGSTLSSAELHTASMNAGQVEREGQMAITAGAAAGVAVAAAAIAAVAAVVATKRAVRMTGKSQFADVIV